MGFLEKTVDAAESGLHKLENLGGNVINSAEHAGADAKHAFRSLVDSVELAFAGSCQFLGDKFVSHEAHSVLNTLGILAEAACNPAAATVGLVQTASNTWESKDKGFVLQKVDSLDNDKGDVSKYFNKYDAQYGSGSNAKKLPAHIDFNNRDLYGKPQKTEGHVGSPSESQDSAALHSRHYKNERGGTAEVTVGNGRVDYEETRNGRVVTRASQTADQSTIQRDGQVATLRTKEGILQFSNSDLEMLQDKDHAEAKLRDGHRIVRKDGKLYIYDRNGEEEEEIADSELKIGNVSVFAHNADMQRSDATPSDQVRMMVTGEGSARLILPNGTVIDMRSDHSALLRTTHGRVFMLDANYRMFVWENDQWVPASQRHSTGPTRVNDDGTVDSDGWHYRNGRIVFAEGIIDLKHLLMNVETRLHGHTRLSLNDNGHQATVETQSAKVEVDHGTVQTTVKESPAPLQQASARTFTTHLGSEPNVETSGLSMNLQMTRVMPTNGSAPTIIESDNTVKFDNGNGPVLHSDGAMDLDAQTHVCADGFVQSGDWSAAARANGTAYGYGAGEGTRSSSPVAGKVQSIASCGESAATDVYAKALGGVVTYDDIGKLNQNIAEVSSLLNQLNGLGATDLSAQLSDTLALLGQAITFAAPKAQAAQLALNSGESSPFIIKEIEDWTQGASPHAAAAQVLARAA